MTNFIDIIKDRGFVSDCTDDSAVAKLFTSNKPVPVYIGFDCTAPSLHVGSLMQIMILRHLQKCGHKPIVLMGGGTTKVGDPSGKDESRQLLDDDAINRNMNSIKQVFEQFLTFGDKPTDAIMVNNADWLSDINYIDFLRDYGRHFSVNRMMSMESVKLRLGRENHLSFLEFNYMILQAYDFVELNKKYGCRVQIGGSDQWGNIVNGIELSRRLSAADTNDGNENIEPLFGLTTPLITTSSGAKMGKTASGAVWLNGDMCSPYDYWQFWRNTEDADVVKFIRLFTEIPLSELDEIASYQGADINKAKIILANAATKLCHGKKEAEKAEQTAIKVFEDGASGTALPIYKIDSDLLKAGIAAYSLLHISGMESSGGAARRLIKGGGAKINDVKVGSAEQIINMDDLNDGEIKLSAGKKRHLLVHIL